MDRREFLKRASAASAAAASAASASEFLGGSIGEKAPKNITANHYGVFHPEVIGGRFAGLEPHSSDEFITPMVRATPAHAYAPTRIKYPYVREGFLKNGRKSDTSKRGSDKFVRVSWDKAMELIASELKFNYETRSHNAVFAGSYGWDCVGKVNVPSTLMQRALNLAGGFSGALGDYSTAAAQVILPHVIGKIDVYERQTTYQNLIENAKNVVFWGVDPVAHLQVGYASVAHEFYTYAKKWRDEAKARKISFFSVDPVFNDTAQYFGAKLISPKPNTDVAMILAMCHTLYTNKLYDEAFIKKYTVGFDKFIDYVMGKTDGVEKSAKWAENICGVVATEIEAFAKTLKRERTFIMGGWAIQRADHGEQAPWAIVTLSAMLGFIGLDGGGFGFGYHEGSGGSPKYQAPGLPGISVATASGGSQKESINIPVARIVDAINNPGSTIDFNGKKITYPEIKMVMWAGGNPFHHHQNRNEMLKAWQKLETVVVADVCWTASARMADIVLPAAVEAERNDIEVVGDYANKGFVAMKQSIKPLGESKSDYEIFRLLAAKFGREAEYTEGRDEMGWCEHLYNQAKAASDEQKLPVKMPDFKQFWEAGYIEFAKPSKADEQWVKMADFRKNPIRNRLGTKSGKIEIFSQTVDAMGYDDCKGHAMWFEPAEWLGKGDKSYPLHLLSPHPKYRLHSQLNNTWLRDLYEVKEREPIWLNPEDAKARGINDGDVVKVFNERGATLAGAVVTEAVMAGVVRMCEGAWYDPEKPGKIGAMCKHGDVNTLTIDRGTSKLAQGPIANTALVQIEKYSGELPAISVFNEPAMV